MKYNYTKSTKETILQMAVRKQYLGEFDKKLAELETAFTLLADGLGDHKELSELPEHLHKNFKSCLGTPHWFDTIVKVKNYISLQSRQNIKSIEFDRRVFITENLAQTLISSKEGSQLIIEFQKFLKEVDNFAVDVETSLNSYSTYKNAFLAMHWIEEFHPSHDKKPTCNIVPIDTINKVNELMGIAK